MSSMNTEEKTVRKAASKTAKTTAKKTTTKRKAAKEDTGKEPFSVSDMLVDRLIEKIEAQNVLPWQRPFQPSAINWFSGREYRGLNRILLAGGEYITYKQLETYNEKHGTDHWVQKGTPTEVVCFYSPVEKKITAAQAQAILKKPDGHRTVFPGDNGVWIKKSWTLRYYRVYDITLIQPNSKGEKLVPRLGNGIIEEFTPAQVLADRYREATGVGLGEVYGEAYYVEKNDKVYIAPLSGFKTTENYYRTLFHELIHSTGIERRLNRPSFSLYHDKKIERSREEMVAEVGSLLLASEAGFRDDSEWVDNSLEYVTGWCLWMKNNKQEVFDGMKQADKAAQYIINGGQLESYDARDVKTEGEPDGLTAV